MKLQTILIAATVAFAASAFAGKDDHTAKHGGIFVEGKAADVEVVAKADAIHVYVYDHGTPSKIEGAKGKLTLLNGGVKTEADLVPSGDKLEAKGSYKLVKGTKGITVVTLAGKPAFTARLEVKQ